MSVTERRFCIVGTMHISKETNDWLREQSIITAKRTMMSDPQPAEYVMAGPYGYVLFVGEDPPSVELPSDLKTVFAYCQEQGCEWLDLDCDGDDIDGLPSYEW